MFKQYDFPKIFQNVVGSVLPVAVINRDNRRTLQNEVESEEKDSCDPKIGQLCKEKIMIQSIRKELMQRDKFIRTLGNYFQKEGRSQLEQLNKSENKQIYKNFLKRKQLTQRKPTEKSPTNFSTKIKQISQKSSHFNQASTHSNRVDDASTNQMKSENKSSQAKLPLNESSREDILKKREESGYKKRNSQDLSADIRQLLLTRSKKKHKTQFKSKGQDKDKERVFSRIPSKGNSQRNQSLIKRKNQKKKTVNFMIESGNELEDKSIENLNRRKNVRKTSRFNAFTRNPVEAPSPDTKTDDQCNWSAKSVVSIKLGSTKNRISSKKSLRSQESIILQNEKQIRRNIISRRYHHKNITFKHIPLDKPSNLKKYKSMNELNGSQAEIKEVERSPRSIRSMKSTKSKLTNKSLKSMGSSKSLLKKLKKSSASILIKSGSPYLITDSQKNIEPIKASKNSEAVYKIKKQKTIFKPLRPITEPDVFAELDNFHNFLNADDIDENDECLGKASKPIVIDSEVHQKLPINNRFVREEGLMIDMGLALLKKMSVLRQKKF